VNWAVTTYDSAFGYVSAHGAPLIDLLDPKAGERVIDLGCGTGTFTAEIAERGAEVLGIDGSPEMIAQATALNPGLSFAVGDAHDFSTSEPYDAVASNAALHWMTRDPDAVIARVHEALRPGGRFVGELGGAGNCAELIAAMQTAWRVFGLDVPSDLVEPLLARINELAAPALRHETGWVADYVRLRFAAVRKPDTNASPPEGLPPLSATQ
jgi:SAM-dependent methyltransferase